MKIKINLKQCLVYHFFLRRILKGQSRQNWLHKQSCFRLLIETRNSSHRTLKFQYSIQLILFQTIVIASSPNILSHPIEYLKGVGPQRGDLLKKELAIFTFNDILHHFPYRHIDRTSITNISALSPNNDFGQVKGRLLFHETIGERNSKRLVAYLKDDTDTIELVWFKGINWIEKTL